jgi:hypothetical protein
MKIFPDLEWSLFSKSPRIHLPDLQKSPHASQDTSWYIFWRAKVCWPLLCLCRPFCIFERCLDSNPESCRSKQARYELSNPAFFLATHLPGHLQYTGRKGRKYKLWQILWLTDKSFLRLLAFLILKFILTFITILRGKCSCCLESLRHLVLLPFRN